MKELLLWFVLAQAADLTTTGIARYRGCAEITPVYRSLSFPVTVGIKGGSAVGLTIYMGKTKSTKYKKWLIGVGAASSTAAAVWNSSQISRCRR